mmetsp:Transcript_40192/g.82285  ORF Transcript_40192/g.82285 Transcript_40192/m.82285 type:complete len:443 (+) Transcript_40192:2-1330(+)
MPRPRPLQLSSSPLSNTPRSSSFSRVMACGRRLFLHLLAACLLGVCAADYSKMCKVGTYDGSHVESPVEGEPNAMSCDTLLDIWGFSSLGNVSAPDWCATMEATPVPNQTFSYSFLVWYAVDKYKCCGVEGVSKCQIDNSDICMPAVEMCLGGPVLEVLGSLDCAGVDGIRPQLHGCFVEANCCAEWAANHMEWLESLELVQCDWHDVCPGCVEALDMCLDPVLDAIPSQNCEGFAMVRDQFRSCFQNTACCIESVWESKVEEWRMMPGFMECDFGGYVCGPVCMTDVEMCLGGVVPEGMESLNCSGVDGIRDKLHGCFEIANCCDVWEEKKMEWTMSPGLDQCDFGEPHCGTGCASVFSVPGFEPNLDYSCCSTPPSWEDITQWNTRFKTGGLGRWMEWPFYVWLCDNEHECSDGSGFCFVFDEEKLHFVPWEQNSLLKLY